MLPPRPIRHSTRAFRRVVIRLATVNPGLLYLPDVRFPVRTANREPILVEMALERVDRTVEKVRAWSGGVSRHIRTQVR
jgi:hypothetical protein